MPLSRRLHRCDRMIQNESRDAKTLVCVCLQRRHECKLHSLCAHARLSALLHTFREYSLTLDCNGVFAIKAFIAIAPATNAACSIYIDHNVTATSACLRAPSEEHAWCCRLCFGSMLKQTSMHGFSGRPLRLSLSNYCMQI